MIPIDRIDKLSNAEFFKAYAEGQLNSLQLPAYEYFERQDVIKEQLNIRIGEQEHGVLEAYMIYVPRIETATPDYRPHVLFYSDKEGEFPKFMACQSAEEAMFKLDMFESTGRLEIENFHGDNKTITPSMVGYAYIKEVLRVRGNLEIERVPHN